MELQKERPPYVTFEVRPVQNGEKSQAEGRVVYEDVDYALITPVGGKDQIEWPVEKWMKYSAKQVEEERMPATWLTHFQAIYSAWKQGQEAPVNGLSVKMWPLATPSDVKHLLAANVLTVEDLAVANEQTLMRIGMGSRTLKQKAEAYLKSAETGKTAEVISRLEDSYTAAALRIEALERENKELHEKLLAAGAVKSKAA
jgi:hypothetical protein